MWARFGGYKRYGSYDSIIKMGKKRFLATYSTLMKKTNDRYAPQKGLAIFELASNGITTRGDNIYTLSAQNQLVDLVLAAQNATDEVIAQMQNIA